MYVTYWYGPPEKFLNSKVYEDVKNAGFTLAGPMASGGVTVETNLRFLDICAEQGMKACIYDSRVDEAMKLHRENDKAWRERIRSVTEDYRHHPALYSYYVLDEPTAHLFGMLADIVAAFKEYDPEHPAYINLLPNYATIEQIGTPTYYDYVKDFIEKVKPAFVSYDHYHFLEVSADSVQGQEADIEETDDERENAIRRSAMINIDRPGFFENLEIVRELAEAHNIPFMVIVLLIQHGPYRNLTEAELRFEAFQSLAYGADMLSYFTYWTVIEPGSWWNWRNGCISCDGTEKLQHYYDVSKVNRDVHAYAEYLDGRKLVKVTHVGKINDKVEYFTGNICSESPVQLTIGEFEGGYTVIANKDISGKAVFRADIARGAARLDTESGEFRELPDGEIVLEAGDMALIRRL